MPDLPLRFEANRGQTDSRVRFMARAEGGTVFLLGTETVLSVPNLVLRTRLLGSNPNPEVTGQGKQPGAIRYYHAGRRASTESYDRVRYRDVYAGIDLIYYGAGPKLEYDFRVAPGADPSQIRFSFEGAKQVVITPEGDLVLETAAGPIREHAPVVFQQWDGRREPVHGAYQLTGQNEVTFRLGRYDPHRELVIDPVITYSTYLSGANNDVANDMKIDAKGYVYLTGSTTSPDFPTTAAGSFQGNKDMFVTKLSPDGKTILFSTFVGQGESNGDEATSIFLDSSGNIYIGGIISKFLLLGDAHYAVVGKLNPDGSLAFLNRVTSTTGAANEQLNCLVLDGANRIYVAGWTDLDTIPIVNGFQDTPVALGSGWAAMLDASAQNILYSTYIGSVGFSRAYGVAVDRDGNMYVTGQSGQIPTTPNAFQESLAGDVDAYVMKINPQGTGLDALVYSTYLGGGEEDIGNAIVVDSHGRAWVTGSTKSNNSSMVPVEFPVTPNAAQAHLGFTLWSSSHCYGGIQVAFCSDAFLTGLSPDGRSLVYSSYLGGDGRDVGQALTLDPTNGRIYVTGLACSFFPVTADAIQKPTTCSGAFLAVLDPAQDDSLVFSTFLGGTGNDNTMAIARGPSGDIWVAGFTTSTDFPLVDPIMKVGGGNGSSVFLTRYSFGAGTPPPAGGGPLGIRVAAGQVTVSWSGGTLQQADKPSGPYQDLPSATSPFQTPANGSSRFFRVR